MKIQVPRRERLHSMPLTVPAVEAVPAASFAEPAPMPAPHAGAARNAAEATPLLRANVGVATNRAQHVHVLAVDVGFRQILRRARAFPPQILISPPMRCRLRRILKFMSLPLLLFRRPHSSPKNMLPPWMVPETRRCPAPMIRSCCRVD